MIYGKKKSFFLNKFHGRQKILKKKELRISFRPQLLKSGRNKILESILEEFK